VYITAKVQIAFASQVRTLWNLSGCLQKNWNSGYRTQAKRMRKHL